MGKFILKAYITMTVVLFLICQTVYGEDNYFVVNYIDKEHNKIAYAMENKYITEEVRFSVPFVLTKYNVTRTQENGYLFVNIKDNKISCIYYDNEGHKVFGDPLNKENYVSIKKLEGQNVSLVTNRYNLSSLGDYNINSFFITEDDEYFYLSLITTGDKYAINQIRISKTGIIDESYLQTIYEIDDELCYSFSAVQALDDEGNSVIVVSVDKNILNGNEVVGRLHDIYVVTDVCELKYSDEVLYSELNKGHLLRNATVAHQAIIVNNNIYFLEGVKYEKYNDIGYLNECILYSLGENITKVSVNEIADPIIL